MTSNAASRAMLRDSISRLKKVRSRCGKHDEDVKVQTQSTGDPFRDSCNLFMDLMVEVKEDITERNTASKQFGQDRNVIQLSNDILRKLQKLDGHHKKICVMVEQAEAALTKAQRKNKSADKLKLLERQLIERESTSKNCKEMLNSLKELNRHRFGEPAAGANSTQQIKLGQKNAMREQLMNFKKRGVNKDGFSEEMVSEGGRLEDDPETAAHMKVLAEQEKKIDQGLTILQQGVSRLHQIALQINSEIDTQNKIIDKTEARVDSQTSRLEHINKRLDKIVKESSPINICVNIGCAVLLLSLVGYLLYEFGVIPGKEVKK